VNPHASAAVALFLAQQFQFNQLTQRAMRRPAFAFDCGQRLLGEGLGARISALRSAGIESGPFGFVRGALSNERPYRDPQ
jgi:hypothetical protein